MLVINSIEKARLQADSWNYSGSGVAWKAQFVLFLGFALLAGGLAGGVVSGLTNSTHSGLVDMGREGKGRSWLMANVFPYCRRLWFLSI